MMSEWTKELTKRLVVGHTRDGRCIYDEQAKRELILACRGPRGGGAERGGAKTAAAAASSGTAVTQAAFVAVHIDDAPVVAQSVCVDLQARLPNGVVVDLRACDMRQARGLLDALGRLQCSASTKS